MGKKKKPNAKLKFLNFIPENAKRILDVGCGDGSFSAHLVEKGCEVVGIDRDSQVLEQAHTRLTEVYHVDIENDDLPCEENSFDCILLADVLDCLVKPEAFLTRCRKYLKDDGSVVVSFANIRYYKVITNLLFKGTWDYMEPGGILWIHHLRFYTLVSMKELFLKCGFNVEAFDRYIYAKGFIVFLNALCLGKLKDLMTYQYYFRLRKDTDWTKGSYQVSRKMAHF
ncbi:MAG: methyltransferase domain-containing protein [Candidatus Omnitrophica bacterium]|nr:methyltransferase domain-containing protein [Candidatus Omnitrophota bacterium]